MWLGLIFVWISISETSSNYLARFIVTGELLLISSAPIGPTFYIITRRYGTDLPQPYSRHFLQGWLFIFLSLVVSLIAAGIFGYQRISELAGADRVSTIGMIWLSCGVFILSITVLYPVITIENFMDDGAARAMRQDTVDYVAEFQANDS